MSNQENRSNKDLLQQIIDDTDLIFWIGKPSKSKKETLQLITLKLLLLLWEEEGNDLENMEKRLSLVDDMKHELAFLRAELYKKILKKNGC